MHVGLQYRKSCKSKTSWTRGCVTNKKDMYLWNFQRRFVFSKDQFYERSRAELTEIFASTTSDVPTEPQHWVEHKEWSPAYWWYCSENHDRRRLIKRRRLTAHQFTALKILCGCAAYGYPFPSVTRLTHAHARSDFHRTENNLFDFSHFSGVLGNISTEHEFYFSQSSEFGKISNKTTGLDADFKQESERILMKNRCKFNFLKPISMICCVGAGNGSYMNVSFTSFSQAESQLPISRGNSTVRANALKGKTLHNTCAYIYV